MSYREMTFKKEYSILLNRRQCGLSFWFHSQYLKERKITYLKMMVKSKNFYELEVSLSCEHFPITEMSTLSV